MKCTDCSEAAVGGDGSCSVPTYSDGVLILTVTLKLNSQHHTGRETTAIASTKSASESLQQAQNEPHAIQ